MHTYTRTPRPALLPSVQAKVSVWVAKKVAEMLGGEEPDFVGFIMGLLTKHEGPEAVRFFWVCVAGGRSRISWALFIMGLLTQHEGPEAV